MKQYSNEKTLISPKSREPEFCAEEAKSLFLTIKAITDGGCDAEVKKINGHLKVIRVKKSVEQEFGFG